MASAKVTATGVATVVEATPNSAVKALVAHAGKTAATVSRVKAGVARAGVTAVGRALAKAGVAKAVILDETEAGTLAVIPGVDVETSAAPSAGHVRENLAMVRSHVKTAALEGVAAVKGVTPNPVVRAAILKVGQKVAPKVAQKVVSKVARSNAGDRDAVTVGREVQDRSGLRETTALCGPP